MNDLDKEEKQIKYRIYLINETIKAGKKALKEQINLLHEIEMKKGMKGESQYVLRKRYRK